VDDIFFIIRIVGVALDAAAFVGADLILVDDPIEPLRFLFARV
jgi:hypothetical protein